MHLILNIRKAGKGGFRMLILISDAFDKSLPDKLSVFGEVTDDTSRISEADVILVRSKTKCTKEYIDQAASCRLIIRGGVGMDNIDREYCKQKGITAVNTPRSSAIAVAEFAFAFMLSTASKICFYDSAMKKGEWAKKTKRSELYGKTLALLGYGNIPKQVAVRAKAFGMNVLAYDPYVKEAEKEGELILKPVVSDTHLHESLPSAYHRTAEGKRRYAYVSCGREEKIMRIVHREHHARVYEHIDRAAGYRCAG